jgi:hypothetical protein
MPAPSVAVLGSSFRLPEILRYVFLQFRKLHWLNLATFAGCWRVNGTRNRIALISFGREKADAA